MQAESPEPSEPQVRTSTLYLSVSGVSRWWGQAVLSGGRSVASTTAPPAPTTGLCHVLLKLLETIEKRKSTCTQAAKHITMGGKEYNWNVERRKA